MKITLLLLAASIATASARIGENAEQLAVRYGKPISGAGTDTIQFKKNEIYIVAKMLNGSCQCIKFTNSPESSTSIADDVFGGGFVLPGEGSAPKKPEPAPQPTTNPLTDAQIESLLQANTGGGKWTKVNEGIWRLEDGSRLADKTGNDLEIKTLEFIRHEIAVSEAKNSKKRAEEEKQTDGF